MHVLKMLWERWKVIAHKIGDFQARVLLSVFYFAIVGPFALGVKAFSDPLRLRSGGGPTWVPRPAPDADTLTCAVRQF